MTRQAFATAAAAVLTLGTGACAAITDSSSMPTTEVVLADVEAVTVVASGDSFLWADREAGTVHDADGVELARVEVSTEGQRGLLGLAVDPSGADEAAVYAAYTDPSERMVVDQIMPVEAARRVWNGYVSSSGANGGRLVMTADGHLLIGVGTLRNEAKVDDAAAVNGKLLVLDPEAGPDQVPVVVSSGWFNPFAFVVSEDGSVWVADNHPTDGDERLLRGDIGAAEMEPVVLPEGSAPSGMAAIEDRLYVCSFTTGRLYRYIIEDGRPSRAGTLVDDCRYDVTALADGSLVYTTVTALHRIENPG